MLSAKAKKTGLFAINPPYVIRDGEADVAEVQFDHLNRQAELVVGDLTYRAYRKGFWSPIYVLELDGAVLAQTEKLKFLSLRWIVTCAGGKQYALHQPLLKNAYELLDGDQAVGRIYREGFWDTQIMIDMPVEVPLPVQVFVFWLVKTFWEQSRTSD